MIRPTHLLSLALFIHLCTSLLALAAEPLPPMEAVQKFQLDESCAIELVASEPDVVDPVHIAFDSSNRLWVVEMSDYPNGPDPNQPGLSRIRVLTDTDGDGRYSDPKLFKENLLFANGLMFWEDGVIVTSNGQVLFLRDQDNDGVCDETQIWFEGFATENPQLRHNHPQLALDGYIYIANGLRGGEIVPGPDAPWEIKSPAKPLSIAGRDFRFHPRTGEYEAVAGMSQFGLTFLDGNRFVCTNRNPARQIVLENDQLTLTPGLVVNRHYEDVGPAGEDSVLYPISTTWTTSNLHANQFTAACGVQVYPDHSLGPKFHNAIFTCDPTANLVHCTRIREAGPTYRDIPDDSKREFLASTDSWFRPVNLALGPDESLYVVDMYRAVIEHPQFMPEELKDRPDLVLGRDRGRIWRIVGKAKQKPSAQTDPGQSTSQTSTQSLLKTLIIDPEHQKSSWEKEHAFRMLFERNDSQTPQHLRELQKDHQLDPMFAMAVLNSFDDVELEDMKRALNSKSSPGLTPLILKIGSDRFSTAPEWIELVNTRLESLQKLAPNDQRQTSPNIRKQVFATLGRIPWTDLTTANQDFVLDSLFAADADDDAEWIAAFLGVSARSDSDEILSKLTTFKCDPEKQETYIVVLNSLATLFARQSTADEVEERLMQTFQSPEITLQQKLACVAGISEGLKGGSRATRELLRKDNGILFANLIDDAVELFGANDPKSKIDPMICQVLGLGEDSASLQLLVAATASGHAQRASSALAAIFDRPSEQLVPTLSTLLPQRRGRIRREILQQMARSTSLAALLLDELESGAVHRTEIDDSLERSLLRIGDADQKDRAKKLLQRDPPADRVSVLAEYQHCLQLESNPSRGMKVFEQQCATCHKVGSIGVNVAPDISDSRTKTPDFFLMNILDPNRAIDANYFSYTVVDTSGRIHTGVLASETSAAMTLKQPEGKTVSIPRDEIEQVKNNGVSLMPVGLERTINPQQMADLISFLKNWRYLDGQVPSEVIKPLQP
ncbi:PVC-type heme-binding CxxCH protein [Thalassoglobus sp. JC818]|uniref:PVC-type heme-binding CxxCH protein n=1 Tax=Thalassoglobus sp. JC818 TaxID=3232136 RepID=UPI00345A6FE0